MKYYYYNGQRIYGMERHIKAKSMKDALQKVLDHLERLEEHEFTNDDGSYNYDAHFEIGNKITLENFDEEEFLNELELLDED